MKATIKKVRFIKEYENRYGTMYLFAVSYNDTEALYSSKDRGQQKFVEGKEVEFEETVKTKDSGDTFTTIKPAQAKFSPQVKREQSKYSGFAMSYAKDLVIADKIPLSEISDYTKKMFSLMVELDKTL